jgi:hypothetical protein
MPGKGIEAPPDGWQQPRNHARLKTHRRVLVAKTGDVFVAP